MNHLSKAKNTSNASKASSNGAGGASSPPLSPFTKMANSPATKGNKEKTARIFKIIIDGQTICLVLTDFYDAKSWLEYQELINGKGNYHPNKVTYLANLRRLTFPGNVYVQEQVLKAIEQILEPEIMSGTKPMTFLPMIDHPKISSESLNGVVKFLVDNLQGQPVPLSNSVFNIVVKNVVLSEDQIECFSVFMVNILPTEIATQIVRNLDDEMYRYGPVISSVVSTSMTSSITVRLIVSKT
jgi:hypothetical protein